MDLDRKRMFKFSTVSTDFLLPVFIIHLAAMLYTGNPLLVTIHSAMGGLSNCLRQSMLHIMTHSRDCMDAFLNDSNNLRTLF